MWMNDSSGSMNSILKHAENGCNPLMGVRLWQKEQESMIKISVGSYS